MRCPKIIYKIKNLNPIPKITIFEEINVCLPQKNSLAVESKVYKLKKIFKN